MGQPDARISNWKFSCYDPTTIVLEHAVGTTIWIHYLPTSSPLAQSTPRRRLERNDADARGRCEISIHPWSQHIAQMHFQISSDIRKLLMFERSVESLVDWILGIEEILVGLAE